MPSRFPHTPGVPLATLGGIAGLLLAGFLWDLTTPLGYVPWLLYLPALLLTLALPYRWGAPALAGLCTLLILAGHLGSPVKGEGNLQAALFNRTLGIAILWLMAGSCLLYKRAETGLRKHDASFRVIFEQAAVGVAQIETATGRFVHVNQRYCEVVGMSAAQMTASTFMDLTHAEDLQEDLDNMARLVAGTIRTFTMDKRYVRPDGSIVWVTLTVSPMWAPGERPEYHIAVVEDITARKRAEEQLDRVSRELQDILDSAPAMIWYKDKENRILRVNRPAAESIGLSPKELAGRSTYDLFPAEAARYHADDLDVIRSGQPKLGIVEPYQVRQDTRWVRTDKIPYRNDAGEITGVVVFAQDITERKQAEEQLTQSHEQLQALTAHLESVREDERARIARELHDDLGQTLTGLKMDLAWLAKSLAPRVPKVPPSRVLAKLEDMQTLVNVSIQGIRRMVLELRPPVLDHLGLDGALEWLAHDFQKRQGILCKVHAAGPFETVDASVSTALFRVAQEAMTNAALHAKAATIRVELAHEERHLRLTVTDDGIGLSGADVAKPTSFGLIGIQERVRLLGGTVAFQGRRGRGTKIIVRIPGAAAS